MNGFTNPAYVLIFVPLSLLLNVKETNGSYILLLIFMVSGIAYNSLFYYRFINKGTKPSLFKAIAVSVFAITFWFMLSGMAVKYYIMTGFWGLME